MASPSEPTKPTEVVEPSEARPVGIYADGAHVGVTFWKTTQEATNNIIFGLVKSDELVVISSDSPYVNMVAGSGTFECIVGKVSVILSDYELESVNRYIRESQQVVLDAGEFSIAEVFDAEGKAQPPTVKTKKRTR